MIGVDERTCLSGARYLRIHYSADPGKTAEWAAAERKSTPQNEWLREMEMREDIHDGEPVYADYRDSWHCLHLDDLLPIVRGSTYIGGWDCGQTLTPAFVLLQITPRPWQVQAILEVVSPGAEPMETFAPRVSYALRTRIPTQWDMIDHWGDTTLTTPSGANGETAQQAARRHGVNIRPGSNALDGHSGRLGAVTALLCDSIEMQGDQWPKFVIDHIACPVLREGFQGAYKLDLSPSGEPIGPGRVLKSRPAKNSFSHVHDALQYAASRVRTLQKRGEM